MFRNARNLVGTGLTLLLVVFMLACGDNDDGESTPTSGQPTGGGTASTGGATAGTEDLTGATVDVLGIWGADELPNFEAMVKPWEDETGAGMDFTGQRGVGALITSRVEGGNPPDIAIPAEVGLFEQLASEGELTPLADCGLEDEIRENYPEAFVELGTVDGTLYGFFMKADTKGTIWYNPKTFEDNGWEPLTAESTWEDLVALTEEIRSSGLTPWSIGIASEADSGWPASDWIQQIILNSDGGAELYDGILDGSVPYTDSRVKEAWERFGEIALTSGNVVQGGAAGVNATNFREATYPPFQDPPGAAMVYLGAFAATFISEQFPDLVPGEDFDFFPFPGGGATGGSNLVFAFNSEPATCSLLRHLAGAEAQSIWVELGGFTSVNESVSLDAYPNDTARAAAQQLLDAPTFRFDLDDALGGETQQAIFAGATDYVANPGQLDSILTNVQQTLE